MLGTYKSLSPSSLSAFDDEHSAESASSTFAPFVGYRKNRKNCSIKHEHGDDGDCDMPKVKISKRASKKLESRHANQIDMMFDACHWYDIPCPHPSCYEKGIRFDDHDAFKLHHEQAHCPRAENGDIDRAKDSLRWQCPVVTTKTVDGVQQRVRCGKVSNSWYNYAGHITSHKEIGHGWGCALPPEGKRKKTNQTHPTQPDRVVCGKKTSTKHHLLAHMHNVHKSYNVIDTNGRQYNRKKERKTVHTRANSMSTSSSSSSSNTPSSTIIGKKRKLGQTHDNHHHHNHNNNIDINIHNTSLLQMRLPEFPKISLTSDALSASATSMPNLTALPSLPAPLGAVNAFGMHHQHLFGPPFFPQLVPFHAGHGHAFGEPPIKKLRASDAVPFKPLSLLPDSRGKQCSGKNVKEQFEFLTLLYYAAEIHKGCEKCNACDVECHDHGLKKQKQQKKEIDDDDDDDSDEDDDSEDEDASDNDMESSLPSLPSLSAMNSNQSNQSMPSYNSSDTLSENTINTTNTGTANTNTNASPLSASASGAATPQQQHQQQQNFGNMQLLFKNLLTTNHPFVMDLQQLCSNSTNDSGSGNNDTQTNEKV